MPKQIDRDVTFCGGPPEPGRSRMKHADSRPRVHLWPAGARPAGGQYWTYSLGPVAMRQGGGTSPGEQLDRALANLNGKAARGVVVIVEPAGGPQLGEAG